MPHGTSIAEAPGSEARTLPLRDHTNVPFSAMLTKQGKPASPLKDKIPKQRPVTFAEHHEILLENERLTKENVRLEKELSQAKLNMIELEFITAMAEADVVVMKNRLELQRNDHTENTTEADDLSPKERETIADQNNICLDFEEVAHSTPQPQEEGGESSSIATITPPTETQESPTNETVWKSTDWRHLKSLLLQNDLTMKSIMEIRTPIKTPKIVKLLRETSSSTKGAQREEQQQWSTPKAPVAATTTSTQHLTPRTATNTGSKVDTLLSQEREVGNSEYRCSTGFLRWYTPRDSFSIGKRSQRSFDEFSCAASSNSPPGLWFTPNKVPLHEMVGGGHQGGSSTPLSQQSAYYEIRRTLLFSSARRNDFEGVSRNLGSLPIDTREPGTGSTVLLISASLYGLEAKRIVKFCLRRGSDINLKNKQGLSALQLCKRNGQKEMATYLFHKGAYDEKQVKDWIISTYDG